MGIIDIKENNNYNDIIIIKNGYHYLGINNFVKPDYYIYKKINGYWQIIYIIINNADKTGIGIYVYPFQNIDSYLYSTAEKYELYLNKIEKTAIKGYLGYKKKIFCF